MQKSRKAYLIQKAGILEIKEKYCVRGGRIKRKTRKTLEDKGIFYER